MVIFEQKGIVQLVMDITEPLKVMDVLIHELDKLKSKEPENQIIHDK